MKENKNSLITKGIVELEKEIINSLIKQTSLSANIPVEVRRASDLFVLFSKTIFLKWDKFQNKEKVLEYRLRKILSIFSNSAYENLTSSQLEKTIKIFDSITFSELDNTILFNIKTDLIKTTTDIFFKTKNTYEFIKNLNSIASINEETIVIIKEAIKNFIILKNFMDPSDKLAKRIENLLVDKLNKNGIKDDEIHFFSLWIQNIHSVKQSYKFIDLQNILTHILNLKLSSKVIDLESFLFLIKNDIFVETYSKDSIPYALTNFGSQLEKSIINFSKISQEEYFLYLEKKLDLFFSLYIFDNLLFQMKKSI